MRLRQLRVEMARVKREEWLRVLGGKSINGATDRTLSLILLFSTHQTKDMRTGSAVHWELALVHRGRVELKVVETDEAFF